MSTRIIDGANLYLRGVYNLMHEELLKTSSIIHADETPIQWRSHCFGGVLKAILTQEVLNYFYKIFDLETKFQDLSAEKRYEKRLEQTKPVLEALK